MCMSFVCICVLEIKLKARLSQTAEGIGDAIGTPLVALLQCEGPGLQMPARHHFA